MLIEQTFTVNASQETTAAFFCDIEQVSSCIPGVEGVRELHPGSYEAVLGVRLGPIRAAFKGSITLDDSEAPQRLKAAGEGRDRATGSVAKVEFTADLAEHEPGSTTVSAVADLALRGRMSQFGTGVVRAAAGEIVQEFAACANRKLAAPPEEQAPSVAPGPTHETVQGSGAGVDAGPGATDKQRAPAGTVEQRHQTPRQPGIVGILLRGLARSVASRLRAAGDRVRKRLGGSGAHR